MEIRIDPAIIERYPEVEIGYLVASVSVQKSDLFIEELKTGLAKHLQDLDLNATTFVTHPNIALWRKIYEEDFQVKAKTYRSSIEALLRRVVTGKPLWNICNIVDLYNCCSILSLLPMGGYDLKKVSGDITIRYSKEGEVFVGLGEREKVYPKLYQVVYADEDRLICWLWNHKDSEDTCIDETSKEVIFFIDAFDHQKVLAALDQLEKNLEKIGCALLEKGVLNKTSSLQSLGVI